MADTGGLTSRTSCFMGLLFISALLNMPLLYFTFNSHLWALVFYENHGGDYAVPPAVDQSRVLVNSTNGIAHYEKVNVTSNRPDFIFESRQYQKPRLSRPYYIEVLA